MSSVDNKNVAYCGITFLSFIVTIFIFQDKLSLFDDILMTLLTKTSIVFTVADIEMTNNDEIQLFGYMLSTVQGIQIVLLAEKVLEHDGWINKVLFWLGTLFLELFLGFTIETYNPDHLGVIFLVLFAIIFVESIIMTIQVVDNPWTGFFVFLWKLWFGNHIVKYLWAYFIGFLAETMLFGLILEIPALLNLEIVMWIGLFVVSPFCVRFGSWVVDKCFGRFYPELYEKDEICTLDKIGFGIAMGLLVVWFVSINFIK